jgi:hypothetical protein
MGSWRECTGERLVPLWVLPTLELIPESLYGSFERPPETLLPEALGVAAASLRIELFLRSLEELYSRHHAVRRLGVEQQSSGIGGRASDNGLRNPALAVGDHRRAASSGAMPKSSRAAKTNAFALATTRATVALSRWPKNSIFGLEDATSFKAASILPPPIITSGNPIDLNASTNKSTRL